MSMENFEVKPSCSDKSQSFVTVLDEVLPEEGVQHMRKECLSLKVEPEASKARSTDLLSP